MTLPLVSIIIPHFQTPELVRLCLRSIRHHTHDVPYEVIVVDNNSRDGRSLDYLRSIEWIRLIERTEGVGAISLGHKEAVDIGFAAARSPLVMAFHTDAIPIQKDWLSWHVEQLTVDPQIAAVGTYKLEFKSPWSQRLQSWKESLFFWNSAGATNGDHQPYIRSHCALYRREVLDQLGLRYNGNPTETAGRDIHFGIEQSGYIAKLLSIPETMRRVTHLNHGTMVWLPELGASSRTVRRGQSRIQKFFTRPEIRAVYEDNSLDKQISQSHPTIASSGYIGRRR